MKIYKRIVNFSLIFVLLNFQVLPVNSKTVPDSFADLAEKLMPSVVNISSTQTIKTTTNPFKNFQFPPGSPFEEMFKEFNRQTERKATALGSGFIIDSKGKTKVKKKSLEQFAFGIFFIIILGLIIYSINSLLFD